MYFKSGHFRLHRKFGITETVQIWKIFLKEDVMNVNVYLIRK